MAESENPQFRIAIVGAGIAGLALAMALHNQGVSFTMYEEAKEYSTVGAGIGFSPNGMRAIDLIEPAFRPLYEEICVGNKGEDAKHIFFEGMLLEPGFGCGQSWHGNSAWGHPDFVRKSAHRKALLDIMTKFIPPDHVRFNKRVAGIEQQSNFVKLGFSDGSTATADIVVGADGIQSVVRSHVLRDTNPSQVAPVYAGAYCYRGVIPMTEGYEILGDLTDVAKFYFGQGRGAVTYRISGGEEFNFLLCVADTRDGWKSKDAVTERVRPEVMKSDFQGPDVDEAFRRLLSKAQPVRWGLFHHLETSTYFRDRAVMIGDSAHASLPFQAAGAAQGLEDAVVLSRILAELANGRNLHARKTPTIHASLAAYDSVRRPRAQRQLEQSAELSSMLFFQHEEDGSDMERILTRLKNGRFDWLWFHDIEQDAEEALCRMNT
ncbi:Uncharacterized protein PECH_005763 [Penicillium ucsense]|uniref:FAD-binding domain-containing protein n=1 Tax=Penicillium ucsense TaxID=2839758 RepID=A0A8J8W2A6_9EURO|nr:Uncharacterized protein PECM_006220 [Penicillium ucsense]KAF7736175.1 Uncharacterized protein PECH_005763 [Penicillium ucsense]